MLFDKSRLQEAVAAYKHDFNDKHWNDEKYKWVAVKHFQDNWNIDASDFAAMLKQALGKTDNLLASGGRFPRRMIKEFAQADPEKVRQMFRDLFDETRDIWARVNTFKTESPSLLALIGKSDKNHYQDENTIFTYLWLRYPDKYYIYKFNEIKEVVKKLQSDLIFKKGKYEENISNFLALYNAIRLELQTDSELKTLLKSQLTDDCYADDALCTLTTDLGYYISRRYGKQETKKDNWYLEDYSSGLTTADWIKLLRDPKVVTESAMNVLRCMKEIGGQATCTQLAKRFGETWQYYNTNSSKLGKRVIEETNCAIPHRDNETIPYWAVLYVGKSAPEDEDGVFTWKLREELAAALDAIENAPGIPHQNQNYWWLNANPKYWSFSEIAVGEVQSYTLYSDTGHKRRIFQNFLDAQAGDIVIGYESTPVKQITAIARISKPQDGKNLYFQKIETLKNPVYLSAFKDAEELSKMECFINPQGSLFKLTAEEYDFLMDIIREENPVEKDKIYHAYTKKDFLSEVFIEEEKYDSLVRVLEFKKNIILQGAPGVGKTFAARRLAYSMMGEKDKSRVVFVQFHQNYSYEDFVMGYKPDGTGFVLKNGIFYNFCQKAASEPDRKYFFIIDEINRGNMSKIFGELLMLIEKDYRGKPLKLAYNDLPFSVPKNLYIIGMMNTADRSLAMIDYALRRRFSFFEMTPGFDSKGFSAYQRGLNSNKLDRLVETIKELNGEIAEDKSLGKGFCIGHSYLCGQENCSDEWLRDVVEYDILPMLAEYWFDEPDKYDRWNERLMAVIK